VPNLDAIGIVCADLDRTRAFYALLDVEVEVLRSFQPAWERAAGNTVALAFRCGNPAEVDEVYARVVAAGFHGENEPWNAVWGQRYAQLHDPDGTPVDLYAAL